MTFRSPCRRVISSSVSAIRAKSPKCTISSLVKVGMPLTVTRLCDEHTSFHSPAQCSPRRLLPCLLQSRIGLFANPMQSTWRIIPQPLHMADYSSHWRNHPAKDPIRNLIPPVTGGITPLRHPPETQTLQSLEESPPQYDLSACGFIQQLEESDDALPYRRQSYAQTRRETFELSTFAHRASLGTKLQGSVES